MLDSSLKRVQVRWPNGRASVTNDIPRETRFTIHKHPTWEIEFDEDIIEPVIHTDPYHIPKLLGTRYVHVCFYAESGTVVETFWEDAVDAQ